MRYSLIHHDVRQKFSLTIGEYLVCDSLHQLSHGGHTFKPNTQIAAFLGLDESTVRSAKTKLIEKGLLSVPYTSGGCKTTPLWAEAVTEARENPEITRENPESGSGKSRHSITNSNNQDTGADKPRIEIVNDEEPRSKRPKADTRYLAVFEAWGQYPLNWRKNTAEIQAAKNILEELTVDDVKWAIKIYERYKSDPYCPSILKPSDLDRKWDNLVAFNKKRNGKS